PRAHPGRLPHGQRAHGSGHPPARHRSPRPRRRHRADRAPVRDLRRRRSGTMTGAPALALLLSAPLAHHEAARVSMGCTYALELHGTDPAVLRAAADAALDEVDRIDHLMSHYRPESPLS